MADIRITDLPGLASPTNGDVLIIHDTDTRTDKKITYNALVASKIEELRSQIGSPLIASTAAGMTDVDRVYVYVGSETGYTAGNWYYYDGTQWVSGGTYNSVAIGDNTITDDKLIQAGGVLSEVHDIRIGIDGTTYASAGEAVRAQIESVLGRGAGITADVKEALLNLLEHVAYTNNQGQTYLDALESALYPPVNLVSITAVYTQSGTVYDTDSLDSLKSDLVVTANYEDGTSSAVSDYTLSGTLAEGMSTITVTYGGKTATFSVTVTHNNILFSIENTDVTSGGVIYSDVDLVESASDLPFTICIDCTLTTKSDPYYLFDEAEAEGGSSRIIYVGKSSGNRLYAKYGASSTNAAVISTTAYATMTNSAKVVFVRTAGTVTVYSRLNTDESTTVVTISNAPYASYETAYPLQFGRGWAGHINRAAIYSDAMTAEEAESWITGGN